MTTNKTATLPSGLAAHFDLVAKRAKDEGQQEYFRGLADGVRIALGEPTRHAAGRYVLGIDMARIEAEL